MRTPVAATLASLWLAGVARADAGDVAARVAAGQERARTGDFAGAIREFEAADAVSPRAAHACLIGLAELRRREPGQAEARFAQCRARATPDDPLPSWLAASERELSAQLAALAPVAVVVDPPTADALITVSGWDAPVLPRTIHLAPGHYRIAARAPGAASTAVELDLADAAPRVVTLRFATQTAPPPAPAPPPRAPDHARSTYLLAGGALAVVAAGVVDLAAVRPTYHTLEVAPTPDVYDAHHGAYAAARDTTIGLLVAGAAALAVGAAARHAESGAAPRVGASYQAGAAVVTLGWTR